MPRPRIGGTGKGEKDRQKGGQNSFVRITSFTSVKMFPKLEEAKRSAAKRGNILGKEGDP